LAPAIEDEDAMPGLWYDRPGKALQGGAHSYGPPVAPRNGWQLVAEARPGGGYLLLVEDANRYWLVDWSATQLARPDDALTEPGVTLSSGVAAVAAAQAQPVTGPGEVATLPPNERRLLIDQAAQVMHVYEGGIEVRTLPISTGMFTSKTFTRAWVGLVGRDLGAATVDGGMQVEQAWYLFPDLFGNILLHTVPYVEQGAVRIYDQPEALGVRASSHGCVRMSIKDAQWLKEWGPVGVPIEITAPPGPIRQAG
jgi:hypothetical protein